MCTQWMLVKTEKTWLLCRFLQCTCASHSKSAGCIGIQQYNVHSMMMQKNNKKMPHSDSCIWWTKQRPMKKRNTRNARTQSNIFFVRKHWEELFNGVQCVCDSVSLCRHKCVNLFAFSQMYQWFRKRACINEILCIERS